ncbi:MAG: biotin transporter BioY [Eubacterium sp.]|nr:biotin transporter BioY [Eubacterium sp.]
MSEKSKRIKPNDIAYIGLSAALITVCAWITIPVGAVPITLQTMGICLVASLFGAKRGVLSTLTYLLLGAVGVPVFSSFKGGIGVLAGATGGYIIGFIFTALIVGVISDKLGGKVYFLIPAMILGVAVCYAFGTAWFMLVYTKEKEIALSKTLALCVTPFLIPDAVKIIIASLLTAKLKKHIKE